MLSVNELTINENSKWKMKVNKRRMLFRCIYKIYSGLSHHSLTKRNCLHSFLFYKCNVGISFFSFPQQRKTSRIYSMQFSVQNEKKENWPSALFYFVKKMKNLIRAKKIVRIWWFCNGEKCFQLVIIGTRNDFAETCINIDSI